MPGLVMAVLRDIEFDAECPGMIGEIVPIYEEEPLYLAIFFVHLTS